MVLNMTDKQHIHKIFADIQKTLDEAQQAELDDVVVSLQQTKQTMIETFLSLYPEHADIIEAYDDN